MHPIKYFALSLFAVLSLGALSEPTSPLPPPVQERLGDGPPAGAEVSELVFSNDGLHVAMRYQLQGKDYMLIDGKRSPAYDAVRFMAFDTGDWHVAYTAQTGDKWRVVNDGVAGPEYDDIPKLFLGHGHLAYVARLADKTMVIIDQATLPVFENPDEDDLYYTLDGKHFVYHGTLEGKSVCVIDGKIDPRYDGLLPGVFAYSEEGSHMAWAAHKDNQEFILVDAEQKYIATGDVGNIAVSPDGQHVAWNVEDAKETTTTYLDGNALPGVHAVKSFASSANGEHLAYLETKGGHMEEMHAPYGQTYTALADEKYAVVLDGKEVAEFDKKTDSGEDVAMVARAFKQRNTPHLFFSPDGNHLACSGPVGEKFRVYVDGKLSNDYDAVQDLVWSADGQHWAYCASRKDGESAHYYLIQDGKETAVPTGVRDVHFSPDGRHVYYVAVIEVGAGERIVSDGKPGEIYDRVGPHAFSADGEHYAFWTQKEKTWTLFFDGKPCVATSSDPNWRTYWDFVHAPIFTNKNTLEFLAIRDDGIYRVTQSLVAK